MSVSIRRATIDDADAIGPLFERYCAYYECHHAPELARGFVEARMRAGDSVVFLAEVDGDAGKPVAVGFVQLYPKWSSTTMRRDWVLNDLFVEPAYRRRGVGRALMDAAVEYCRGTGALKVTLKTEATNAGAQALYESLGWEPDEVFKTYNLRFGG